MRRDANREAVVRRYGCETLIDGPFTRARARARSVLDLARPNYPAATSDGLCFSSFAVDVRAAGKLWATQISLPALRPANRRLPCMAHSRGQGLSRASPNHPRPGRGTVPLADRGRVGRDVRSEQRRRHRAGRTGSSPLRTPEGGPDAGVERAVTAVEGDGSMSMLDTPTRMLPRAAVQISLPQRHTTILRLRSRTSLLSSIHRKNTHRRPHHLCELEEG